MYRVIILALLFALLARFAYKLGVSNKFFSQSIFDLGDIYNEVVEDPEEESLRRHPRIQRSFLEGETYKNFQVKGRLQDQSKCLLMVRCVCLNITGIFHV